MRRVIWLLLLVSGCRFDSMVAVHYHAAPGDERIVYRDPPASQPAATQPAEARRPIDLLKEFLP